MTVHVMPRTSRGFTLIELVVTVTVLAILAALAAPNFADFMRRNAVESQANEFLGALRLARSTAISQNRFVSMCPSRNASATEPQCEDSNDFSVGWIMYTSPTSGAAYATSDKLVRVAQAVSNVSLLAQNSGKIITFTARGASPAGALSLFLCAKRGSGAAGQSTVRATGRRFDIQASGRSGVTPLPSSADADQAQAYCKPT
ncbi:MULTISPECIES: GspH/FimT family pseudopilin [Luteibacter]|uniref:GspH/FimT family pseudopilin n=1 Tax=Luteibacter TaxID=242605 RepID=UPI000691BE16|nr:MULTISPECIES: GspH/FimT family pseudopilin [unclassified Luteibacter]MDR6643916.1 type IV fimbrial biogenesis protein FimT [Luteibacter sp. 1214]